MAIYRIVPSIVYYVEANSEDEALDIAEKQYQKDMEDSMLCDCNFDCEEIDADECQVSSEEIIRDFDCEEIDDECQIIDDLKAVVEKLGIGKQR